MPKMKFVKSDGETVEVDAPVGSSVLEIARTHDIDLPGACDGACACAMCHVIVDEKWFDKLPKASEQEEDALDIVFGLTPTSRLACQIIMANELDGLVVKIPENT
ncbi:MAG: 2Fe-2S iron-sulfur cluster-binding protein [Alphaproteobacteria bacterium]